MGAITFAVAKMIWFILSWKKPSLFCFYFLFFMFNNFKRFGNS